MHVTVPVVIVSNYSLPSRILYRYRGIKYARYGLSVKAQFTKTVAASVSYHNYDVRAPTVHTIQFTIHYKF